jgi:hypothetical protein
MSDQVCFEITVFMINAKAKSIRKGGYIYLAQLVLTCYFWDWGRNAVKRRPLFSFQQCLNRNSEIGEREIVRLSCVLVLSRVFVFAVLVLLLLLPAASFNAGGRAEPRRRPRRDPSEKPEWNPAGSQARICCERM